MFRRALDLAPAAIVVVDREGRIVLVNRESERLFGYSREELIGRPVEQLVPERYRGGHAGRRAAFLEAPQARPMGRGRDLHALRSDGTEVPVEIGLNPIEPDEGQLIVATVIDQTERLRAEARFRTAVESAPSGMLMVDAAGAIVLANREAERTFGYAGGELVGKTIEQLVPQRFAAQHPAHREQYFRFPEARRMGTGRELFGVRKDGDEFPVEVGLTPITTDEGTFVLASVVDITLRRSLESQLREAQRLETIGVLASGIAHDFNNVLLAITGYAELALEDRQLPGSTRDDIRQILTAAERGSQVVERMLEVGRRPQTSPVPSDLSDPIVEAIELLQASALKSVEVRRHFDPATPRVLCDPTQIHQIIMNLGSNAGRALSGPDAVFSVSLTLFAADSKTSGRHPALNEGLYAHLTVTDNGIGMSAETLERAFEPFYTSRETGQGSGLGLWLVHEIVQSLRGVVELSSRPGEGTRIDIFLPAAESAASAGDSAVDAADRPEDLRPHIVYVEDEPPLAELGRRRLESVGYRVTTYTSSIQALEDVRSSLDDMRLLVTDNTMPRLSGLELAKEVVRLRPGLPVLMVSGLAHMQSEDAPAYVTRLLQKPHTMDDLEKAVRELVGNADDATP